MTTRKKFAKTMRWLMEASPLLLMWGGGVLLFSTFAIAVRASRVGERLLQWFPMDAALTLFALGLCLALAGISGAVTDLVREAERLNWWRRIRETRPEPHHPEHRPAA